MIENNNHVITAVKGDSNEVYLSAIFTDNKLTSIIQNTKVSKELILEDVFKFLDLLKNEEYLFPSPESMDYFLENNVIFLEAENKIDESFFVKRI